MLSLFLGLCRKQGCCHFCPSLYPTGGFRQYLAHCTFVRNACEHLPRPQRAKRSFNPFSPLIGTIPGVTSILHTWMGLFTWVVLSAASVLGPYHFSPLLYSWALEVAPGSEVTSVLRGARCQSWAGGLLLPQGCIVRPHRHEEAGNWWHGSPHRHPKGALNSEGRQGDSRGEGIRWRCTIPAEAETSFTGGGECLQRDSQALLCLGGEVSMQQPHRYSSETSSRLLLPEVNGSASLDNLQPSSD